MTLLLQVEGFIQEKGDEEKEVDDEDGDGEAPKMFRIGQVEETTDDEGLAISSKVIFEFFFLSRKKGRKKWQLYVSLASN